MLKRMVTLGAAAFVVAVMTSISVQWPDRVVFSAGVSATPTALDPTIVGYWKLDEGTGTIAQDSSGNGNDGTLTNGPTWSTGQLNGALQFDGIDDYVNISHAPSLQPANVTVSAWIKPTSISTYDVVLNKVANGIWDDGYGLEVSKNSKMSFRINDENSPSNFAETSVSTGVWTHVVGTYDGSVIRIYKDGILAASTSNTNGITYAGGNVGIGDSAQGPDPSTKFTGLIDDVRIYNRALSASEVLGLFFNPDSTPP